MEENKFQQHIMYRGVLMDATQVIELRRKEMEANKVQPVTEEQLQEKKDELGIVEEPKRETEAEEKKRIKQLLKDKGVKFFPGACLNTLRTTCEKNGIIL